MTALMADSTVISASTSATPIASLSDLLRTPDDLVKLVAHRKKLLKEKAQIDAKLNDGVRLQLEETRNGLRKLQEGRNEIARLREEMISIEQMKDSADGEEGQEVFSKISKIASLHRTLTQTVEIIRNLQSMSSKVHNLSLLLESDKVMGPRGPSPNLLQIHFQLTQLEGFRNETMHLAKKSGSMEVEPAAGPHEEGRREARLEGDRKKFLRWFEKLDDLGREFEEWLFELARNILGLVRDKNGGTVVRLLKIIEIEGKEDQKAVAMRLVRKIANADAASKYRSMQANARVIKNYRHKLLDILSQSIRDAFLEAEEKAGGDYVAYLDSLSWMYQDLLRIESDIIPIFPEDYNIHEFYVKGYHKNLNESLQKIVQSNPEASVLLRMHAWIKEYRGSMKELAIPLAWLQPPLLDGKAQDLIEDYVKLIVTKIDEWTINLMRTEIRDFGLRNEPPESDSEGMYGLQYAVILFQMVNQQVDLAADSGQGAVLARVVSESGRVMKQTQLQWTRVVEQEFRRQIERPETAAPGLVEYVIALANDQLKSADYAEAMSSRLEPLVSEKYGSVISEKLNEAIDGYLDVAKKCTRILIDLVFNDLKAVSKEFFGDKWYREPLMDQIVETIRDYMGDYQAHLNPSIFELLVEDLLVSTIVMYLNGLRRIQSNNLHMPRAVSRLRGDIQMIEDFFRAYKKQEDLEPDFEILHQIEAMLSASPGMVFMDYWSFAKKHGPNLGFVEALMRGRDDMDRQTTNEVLDTIRRKIREEGLGDPEEPTIMIKVKNVESGLLSNLPNLTNLPNLAGAYSSLRSQLQGD